MLLRARRCVIPARAVRLMGTVGSMLGHGGCVICGGVGGPERKGADGGGGLGWC